MQPYIHIQPRRSQFLGRAICIAIALHGVLMVSVIWASPNSNFVEPPKALSVVMIRPAPKPAAQEKPKPELSAPEEAVRVQPSPPVKEIVSKAPVQDPPEETPEPISEPNIQPDVIPQAPPNILQNEGPAINGEISAPQKPHIPSRWALKPPLAETRLQGLGFSQDDIECLTSLEDHCQALRKEVFAEYQLTETELVWTPNRPDIGMPAEFRGLSDQEIMEKLGMNYAGGNAFTILPGITIDGPLWDKLHGVNKTCKLRQNYGSVLDGTAGTVAPRRVCD